jgi:cephalosporin hydroxylase
MNNDVMEFYKEKKKRISLYSHDDNFLKLSQTWIDKAFEQKYMYNFECLGRPIIQLPQDIIAFQELVWQTKPELIIETGIAHGGSLMLSASMLALLEYADAVEKNEELLNLQKPKRMVMGIDIDIRKHNQNAIEKHPMHSRIKMIEGSSISENIALQIKDFAKGFKTIMVCLDSNHTHNHVLQELNLYADLVTVGNYCIVWDTIVEHLHEDSFPDRPWNKGNNPKTAVWEFLKTHDEFEIDKTIQNKLLITVAPDGYLKRIK